MFELNSKWKKKMCSFLSSFECALRNLNLFFKSQNIYLLTWIKFKVIRKENQIKRSTRITKSPLICGKIHIFHKISSPINNISDSIKKLKNQVQIWYNLFQFKYFFSVQIYSFFLQNQIDGFNHALTFVHLHPLSTSPIRVFTYKFDGNSWKLEERALNNTV